MSKGELKAHNARTIKLATAAAKKAAAEKSGTCFSKVLQRTDLATLTVVLSVEIFPLFFSSGIPLPSHLLSIYCVHVSFRIFFITS